MSSKTITQNNEVQTIVDNWLKLEDEEKSKRERSGKWNPSSFGRCYRYQFWNRKNERQSNPIDVETLRKFRAGKLYHDFVQALLPEHQTEVEVNINDVYGFADIVTSNEVTDIKSIRSYGMRALKKLKGNEIIEDKYNYILQVMSYAVILEKARGRLVFIDKDSVEIVEFIFETKEWESDVMDEIGKLRVYWEKDELPPARPRAFAGQECDYCVFKDKCDAVELPFRKERENGGSKDSTQSRGQKSFKRVNHVSKVSSK